jgi:hypothetical protein
MRDVSTMPDDICVIGRRWWKTETELKKVWEQR